MFTAFLNGEIDLTLEHDAGRLPPPSRCVDPSIGTRPDRHRAGCTSTSTSTPSAPTSASTIRRSARRCAWPSTRQGLVDVLFPGAGVTPACSITPAGPVVRTELECAPYDPEAAARCARRARLGRSDPSEGTRVNGDQRHALPDVHELGQPDPPHDDGPHQPGPRCDRRRRRTSRPPMRQRLLRRLGRDRRPRRSATSIAAPSTSRCTPTSADRRPVQRLLLQLPLHPDRHRRQPRRQQRSRASPIAELDEALDALGHPRPGRASRTHGRGRRSASTTLANEIPLYYRAEPIGVSDHVRWLHEEQPQHGDPALGRRELVLHPRADPVRR